MPKFAHLQAEEYKSGAARFAWALKAIYGGSQAEMAKALGCSASMVSRIASGGREPGARLLTALANQPGLNRLWVLTGEGEPLAKNVKALDRALPVLDQFPEAADSERLSLVSPERRRVAEVDYRPTRCFLRLRGSDAVTADQREKIAPGDLLLVELDPVVWRQDLRVLDGRLCIVRCKALVTPYLFVARVACLPAKGGDKYRLYVTTQSSTASQAAEIERLQYGKELRSVDLDGNNPEAETEQFDPAKGKVQEINLDDVLGVVLELRRSY